MRPNKINGLVRKSLAAGMMLSLWGVATWAGAQQRTSHPASGHHVVYVPVGHVRGRTVYERRTASAGSAVHGRRAVAHAGQPTHARVHVNVTVNPVYPIAGPAYLAPAAYPSGYPYPYASWMYPSAWYYADLTAMGYSDGFHRGRDDAEDHRPYDPYRKGNKNPGSPSYDAGFINGYAAGYGH